MNTAAVFISRDLKESDHFRAELESNQIKVVGKSFLRFEGLPFGTVPETNWIFFYSKNGVAFFLKSEAVKSAIIKRKIQFGVMGKGTAKALEEKGLKAAFIGEGQPDQVAEAFLKRALGKKVLFVRATHSRDSVKKILGTKIEAQELVVYQNRLSPESLKQIFNVYVFTSPLNVRAFFSKNQIPSESKVVAIGQTTAKELYRHYSSEVYISMAPNQEAMASMVLQLITNRKQ